MKLTQITLNEDAIDDRFNRALALLQKGLHDLHALPGNTPQRKYVRSQLAALHQAHRDIVALIKKLES